MDLLNILAQVVVIIGIFLWMVLKGIWHVLFVSWEITRDYSPIIAKKVLVLLKKFYVFSRKWLLKVSNWLSIHRGSLLAKLHEALNKPKVHQAYVEPVSVITPQVQSHVQPQIIEPVAVVQPQVWVQPQPSLISIVIESLKSMLFKVISGIGKFLVSLSSIKMPTLSFPTLRLPKLHSKVFSKLSLAGMVVSFVGLFVIFFPDLVFAVIPFQTAPIESAVNQSALGGNFTDGNLYSKVELPAKNEYLPDGNWLVIPKIGVLTQINEAPTAQHEEALEKGVWRVPEFADPTAGQNYPTILVAHKFGYLAWSNKFRHQNSFYNLEKLEIGDTFDVIWDHRKFTYEIYAGEEGKEITDYKADMILYTCKYLNSPARIFRYARRVEY